MYILSACKGGWIRKGTKCILPFTVLLIDGRLYNERYASKPLTSEFIYNNKVFRTLEYELPKEIDDFL